MSHLGQALAHEACRRGFDVLFIDTAKMLTHLAGCRADGTHEQRLARYTRPDPLVLDDFGLKPLREPGAEDLYDVINERYEKASTRTSARYLVAIPQDSSFTRSIAHQPERCPENRVRYRATKRSRGPRSARGGGP